MAAPDEEFVAKPPGMHHKTFVRLGRDHLKVVEEWRACYHKWGLELAERYSRYLGAMERERIMYGP